MQHYISTAKARESGILNQLIRGALGGAVVVTFVGITMVINPMSWDTNPYNIL
jgi:hypothetical protein